ncbi:hypothetical protein [Sphingomonas soli]|uniref:hypothetical protein n=1 Tax=Sphingomonas soli TaxID=266127 RepID=UPI000836B954|nr:hypothetical protein [Sphingomonas soli]
MISRRATALTACTLAIVAGVLIAGHEPIFPPPRGLWLGTLPVQGDRADAMRAGLTHCTSATRNRLRCRKDGVMLMGLGPYTAAVDMYGADGRGGFYQLTLWDSDDQDTVQEVGTRLKAQGWSLCRTAHNEFAGDQEIYTRAGAPVRFSIDISYWGKRRLRILPELNEPTGHCWSH